MSILLGTLGLISLAVAVYGYQSEREAQLNLFNVRTQSLYDTKALSEVYQSLEKGNLGEDFNQIVALEGAASARGAMQTTITNLPCIFYKTSLFAVAKSTGKVASKALWEGYYFQDFYLQDDFGDVLVEVRRKEVKLALQNMAKPVYDTFQEQIPESLGSIDLKTDQISDISGYQVREEALEVGRFLYVYGELRPQPEGLKITEPQDKAHHLMLSDLPKAEFVKTLRASLRQGFVLAAFLAILGGGLLYWAVSLLR